MVERTISVHEDLPALAANVLKLRHESLEIEQAVKTERNLTTAVTSAGRAVVRPLPVIKGPSAAWLSAVERLVDREGRRDSARKHLAFVTALRRIYSRRSSPSAVSRGAQP
jgi:hypothetical protein